MDSQHLDASRGGHYHRQTLPRPPRTSHQRETRNPYQRQRDPSTVRARAESPEIERLGPKHKGFSHYRSSANIKKHAMDFPESHTQDPTPAQQDSWQSSDSSTSGSSDSSSEVNVRREPSQTIPQSRHSPTTRQPQGNGEQPHLGIPVPIVGNPRHVRGPRLYAIGEDLKEEYMRQKGRQNARRPKDSVNQSYASTVRTSPPPAVAYPEIDDLDFQQWVSQWLKDQRAKTHNPKSPNLSPVPDTIAQPTKENRHLDRPRKYKRVSVIMPWRGDQR